MKGKALKLLIILAFLVVVGGVYFIGLPWLVQTVFSIFGIAVTYVQAIAVLALTTLVLGLLAD